MNIISKSLAFSRFVTKVGFNGTGSWKCLQERGLDGSPSYHPLISLSESLLLSLIAEFMTSLRGHQRGYTFRIPNSVEVEGMRQGGGEK